MKVDYNWSPETGIATCILECDSRKFIGTAKCHPDDLDMESERTGLFIAECRAYINYKRYLRDTRYLPQYNILKHTYQTALQTKGCENDYHAMAVIRKQMQIARKKLDLIKAEIVAEQAQLKFYIDQKDKLYNRIRMSQANKQ